MLIHAHAPGVRETEAGKSSRSAMLKMFMANLDYLVRLSQKAPFLTEGTVRHGNKHGI